MKATFQPRRTDDLREGARRFVGVSCDWTAVWLIEEGIDAGEMAFMPSDAQLMSQMFSGLDLDEVFVWVPEGDLRPDPMP